MEKETNINIYFPRLFNSTNIEFIQNNNNETKFLNLTSKNITSSNRYLYTFVRDPCSDGFKYRLNPKKNKNDEFIFLINSSIYHIKYRDIINNTDYCFGYIDKYLYSVVLCHKENNNIISSNINSSSSNKNLIASIGMMISLPFLLITLVVYIIISELKNLHGCVLINYITCLFIAYLILSIAQLSNNYINDQLCTAIAFVIHFSFLASFFWLNVMCFDIWWTFGGFRALQGSIKQRERKKFIIYSSYAWGCAGILTGICLIMDFHPSIPSSFIRPRFGEQSCWFTTDAAKAIYFYGPMGVTVVCNIILFVSTAIKIVNHKKETAHHLKGIDSHRHDDNKQWFNLYLKLFIVMGINWSMEIISWLCKDAPDYVWYVTDIANTLQGLIIFIIFVWKDKIKRLLLKRFGCKDSRFFQSRNSTRSGYHSSMSTRTNTSTLTPLQDKFKSTNSVEKNMADDQTDVF
ncbi:G-protein coupled receptor Mth2-like isoform X6 [Microplitis mediator]|uniref:G-protein coupled receptor Mth2-like isoform X6 n=1 Tax=Microplitis mediator TaxID=375433 RepID=UPI00255359AD|nr:G-protein coupled receptor Mth2-like isoform X6 [Microplitis mediator]